MSIKWEVQMDTFIDGWVNTWHEDGKPLLFNTVADAQKELDELLAEVKAAVARGDMDEEYDIADYRIVPIEVKDE